MAGIPVGSFLRHLRQRLSSLQSDHDACLLERFVQQHDQGAFAALLARYGPLVLRVCRQVLAQEQDVEDAFQATFLVLARRAGAIRQGELLAAWLHAVAYRVAQEIRTRSDRRQPEQRSSSMPSDDTSAQVERRELSALLHEEVNRLPTKYRQPIVLCYLDGQSHEQAADRLSWPVGTVRTRLSRGRELLHSRLLRRGVALSTAAFLGCLAEANAAVSVPVALTESTLEAALLVVAGGDPAGAGISTSVVTIVQGVVHTMFLSKLKLVGVVVLLLVAAGGGLGFWSAMRASSAVATAVEAAPAAKKNVVQVRIVDATKEAPPAERMPEAWIHPEANKLTNKQAGEKNPAHLEAVTDWLPLDERDLKLKLPQLNVTLRIHSKDEKGFSIGCVMTVGNAVAELMPKIADRPGACTVVELMRGSYLAVQVVQEPAAGARDKAPPAQADPKAGGVWEKLFEDEAWYKSTKGEAQVFKGTLQAIPNADGPSTLQRTSYYKLGDRTIYTGAKKVAALDKLVGKAVEMRGKPVDMNLEGQSLKEIWPATVRPAAGGK